MKWWKVLSWRIYSHSFDDKYNREDMMMNNCILWSFWPIFMCLSGSGNDGIFHLYNILMSVCLQKKKERERRREIFMQFQKLFESSKIRQKKKVHSFLKASGKIISHFFFLLLVSRVSKIFFLNLPFLFADCCCVLFFHPVVFSTFN